MAPVIVSKRGFLALVLWVLKGRNGSRVIIRIMTGHSNLVSCFVPRIRALARYFTSAFASVKYLSQRPHPRVKTWHKIWMTGLNPTNNTELHCCSPALKSDITWCIRHAEVHYLRKIKLMSRNLQKGDIYIKTQSLLLLSICQIRRVYLGQIAHGCRKSQFDLFLALKYRSRWLI